MELPVVDPVVSGHRIPWFSLAIILAILLVTGDTGLRHGKTTAHDAGNCTCAHAKHVIPF